MTNSQTPNRLHRQMADVVALEAAIEQALGELIPEVSNNSEVTAVFKDFRAMTQGHLQALTTRLQTVSDVPIPDTTGKDVPQGDGSDGYPVSTEIIGRSGLHASARPRCTLRILVAEFRNELTDTVTTTSIGSMDPGDESLTPS